jgi:TPR repeat protein
MRNRLAILLCALFLAGCAGKTGADLKTTFDLGLRYYDGGDYADAYKIWHTIDKYDLAAMRNVAMMLREGKGVAKDPKAAEDLLQTAADAGLPTAQADLADMLMKGEAGPPDYKDALPLLAAAAAANHPVAQFKLGQLYETGWPGMVPQNTTVARRLYAAAAGHGMKAAQERLDGLGPEPAAAAPQAAPAAPPAPFPPAPAVPPLRTNPQP